MKEQLETIMGLLASATVPEDPAPHHRHDGAEPNDPDRLKGRRVLIVDDDPSQAALLCRRLVRGGFDEGLIELAESGFDALVAASDRPFAFAFVDWRMPGLDGLETARRLRGIDPRMLIVGHSSDCTRSLRAAFIAAGADDCVMKPVTEPMLDAIVLRWLSGAEER